MLTRIFKPGVRGRIDGVRRRNKNDRIVKDRAVRQIRHQSSVDLAENIRHIDKHFDPVEESYVNKMLKNPLYYHSVGTMSYSANVHDTIQKFISFLYSPD